MNRVSCFPSRKLKLSKNIKCLQSSTKRLNFQNARQVPARSFHTTQKFEEQKVAPSTDPVVNARLLDTVITIENDLSQLIKGEAKELDETFKKSVAKLQSTFLSASYAFTEKPNNRGVLSTNVKGRIVEIEWDLTVVPKMEESDLSTEILNSEEETMPLSEDGEEDGNEEEASVTQESDIDADLSQKSSTPDVNFDVTIQHNQSAVCIRCTAGADSRLYILSVSKTNASPEDDAIEVTDLSEELQQRLYDYLEELSVADPVACFIRQYNLKYRDNKQAKSLRSLLPYFSK